MKQKVWNVLSKLSKDNVVDLLLQNRSLKTNKEKEEFFKPSHPSKMTLQELGISKVEMNKAIKRIKLAQKNNEKVIIYGDYDADGVTATAILWEALHKFGLDVLPYIPDRFKEGYGINAKSVEKIKIENPKLKLIITVDNGIVANSEINKINKMGVDVIVTDHHQPSKTKPKALAIIHTTQISGSAVSWILAREVGTAIDGLELTAIGTIADQMPLIGPNRSFAKYGLEELRKTKRAGLTQLIEQAGIKKEDIGTYEINYIIAPRINSMGRLMHAIDSLRLLCTNDKKRGTELARLVSKTNYERQRIVDDISVSVRNKANELTEGIIFLSDESYHEGVIGLAAGRLVEEFYRPAIVVSKGKELSKGSARSISGFNIIEAIREQSSLLIAHRGHTMAAGFTIETSKLSEFQSKLNKSAKKLLTKEMLLRKLKIDCELDFNLINWDLVKNLKEFEPTGQGNSTPTFVSYKVEVMNIKLLGKEKTHLKLKLKKDNKFFDAIGFNMASDYTDLEEGAKLDVVYFVEENEWNGTKSLQLKIKDLRSH